MKKVKASPKPNSLKSDERQTLSLKIKKEVKLSKEEEKMSKVHVLNKGIICDTEARGYATPQGKSPFEIVVDASEGFVPLWAKNTTLHWRFRERSISNFENPTEIKKAVRELLGEALLAWGDAAPVKFKEDEDVWDFEIIIRQSDECNTRGCVLASAFFPDGGRHELVIYPKMFSQSYREQVETMIHEIGHIYGLRHFFANISESQWPSEIFGVHSKFSIMNYGELSALTDNDKTDLKSLYDLVWKGELTEINGTPIRFVRPYHTAVTVSRDNIFVFE